MTWTGANHIHGWLVENRQSHRDDSGTYHIQERYLRRLYEVCELVVEHSVLVDAPDSDVTEVTKKAWPGARRQTPERVILDDRVARELLPRRNGYGFGSQAYDEEYLKDVFATRDWLWRMIEDIKAGNPANVFYSSDW